MACCSEVAEDANPDDGNDVDAYPSAKKLCSGLYKFSFFELSCAIGSPLCQDWAL